MSVTNASEDVTMTFASLGADIKECIQSLLLIPHASTSHTYAEQRDTQLEPTTETICADEPMIILWNEEHWQQKILHAVFTYFSDHMYFRTLPMEMENKNLFSVRLDVSDYLFSMTRPYWKAGSAHESTGEEDLKAEKSHEKSYYLNAPLTQNHVHCQARLFMQKLAVKLSACRPTISSALPRELSHIGILDDPLKLPKMSLTPTRENACRLLDILSPKLESHVDQNLHWTVSPFHLVPTLLTQCQDPIHHSEQILSDSSKSLKFALPHLPTTLMNPEVPFSELLLPWTQQVSDPISDQKISRMWPLFDLPLRQSFGRRSNKQYRATLSICRSLIQTKRTSFDAAFSYGLDDMGRDGLEGNFNFADMGYDLSSPKCLTVPSLPAEKPSLTVRNERYRQDIRLACQGCRKRDALMGTQFLLSWSLGTHDAKLWSQLNLIFSLSAELPSLPDYSLSQASSVSSVMRPSCDTKKHNVIQTKRKNHCSDSLPPSKRVKDIHTSAFNSYLSLKKLPTINSRESAVTTISSTPKLVPQQPIQQQTPLKIKHTVLCSLPIFNCRRLRHSLTKTYNMRLIENSRLSSCCLNEIIISASTCTLLLPISKGSDDQALQFLMKATVEDALFIKFETIYLVLECHASERAWQISSTQSQHIAKLIGALQPLRALFPNKPGRGPTCSVHVSFSPEQTAELVYQLCEISIKFSQAVPVPVDFPDTPHPNERFLSSFPCCNVMMARFLLASCGGVLPLLRACQIDAEHTADAICEAVLAEYPELWPRAVVRLSIADL